MQREIGEESTEALNIMTHSEEVSNLGNSRNKGEQDGAMTIMVPNKVTVNFDVPSVFMKDLVLGQYGQHFHYHSGVVKDSRRRSATKWCSGNKNRYLLDMLRCRLLESSVPPHFFSEALPTVVHLINSLPSVKHHILVFSKHNLPIHTYTHLGPVNA